MSNLSIERRLGDFMRARLPRGLAEFLALRQHQHNCDDKCAREANFGKFSSSHFSIPIKVRLSGE